MGYGYERRLRELYGRITKDYEISKIKTFECEISKLYNFMKNMFKNSSFEFFPTEITTDNQNKNMRIKCKGYTTC